MQGYLKPGEGSVLAKKPFEAIAIASGPESLTMALSPGPGGVAAAAIVSFGSRAANTKLPPLGGRRTRTRRNKNKNKIKIKKTCDILVPTLRVGTHIWDALRPNDPEARHRP